MDLLDRVMAPASDLLGHIDDLLARHGAPPDHPVWALIRRVGALPADALAQVAALAPEGIRAAAGPVAAFADNCRLAASGLPVALDGHGVAAQAYASRWAGLSGQIVDERDGLAGRVTATADYMRDVAEWAQTARHDLALEIGACLGSAEAVAVRATTTSGAIDHVGITAAADLAVRVLSSVARAIETGWQVRQRWADIQAETPLSATTPMTVDLTGHIEAR